ncbi:CAP domain-containing protein [Leucosporidium creatinivorum]|uniref:CAP domain-containing protein n=1 Tax=Leucosporidium creatinivorum TaxID=106004 RepID=A0A1Y2FRU8_9BASI|nr:CAP domain-containing protein [Leucosporidium creatinivorum]
MLPSTAAFILSLLASTVVAVPKPDTAVSKVGSAIEASDVVARSLNEETHTFNKRQTCKANIDCRSLPAMWAARPVCKSGTCVYACNTGYTYNAYTSKCQANTATPRQAGASVSASSATPTSSARPTTTTTRPPTTTTRPPTTTTTTRPATTTTTTPASTSTPLTTAQQQALDEHNRFRALHGAVALKWDPTLAAAATTWGNKCVFEHSRGAVGPYGENLAATAGGGATLLNRIKLWEDEATDYDPANPVYSHFTQMVWKATTTLGCADVTCPPGTIFDAKYGNAQFLVCEYAPPGNAGNDDNYRLNVQP